MTARYEPKGYVFVALPDPGYDWDAAVELVPGKSEQWEAVPAGDVVVGKPVWILQCGARSIPGRGFYGRAETIDSRPEYPNVAWLRYVERFEPPVLLSAAVPSVASRLRNEQWENNRLAIELGIKPNQTSKLVECGFMGTVFPVYAKDETRVRNLFPGLPALA